MVRKKMTYGGLASIGTASFALAMIFPVFLSVPFAGDVSVWSISPLICCAAIILVASAASFPLWCTRKRAWLAPLVVSCVVAVPALAVFSLFISDVVSAHTTSYWSILSYGAEYPLSLIPTYLSAVSFPMLLAGALVARTTRASSASGWRDGGTRSEAPTSISGPGGKQP
jgi:hypothetical protein